MTHLRGMAEDLSTPDWLKNEIWPAEAKFVDYEFTRDGTELAVAELIKGGCTCMVDMYFFPEASAEVAARVGFRTVIAITLMDIKTNYAETFEEYFKKANEVISQNKNPLIKYAIAPHAPYTVSDENLIIAWKRAQELKLPFHIHLHETKDEVEDSTLGRDSIVRHKSDQLMSPVKNFNRMGIIGPALMAVHMTQLDDEEIAMLAKNQANVVHCPESNLKLASGFCPVQKLLDAGINVCLGTDSAASNNDLSMLGEIKTAALLGKMVARDATAMKVHSVIRMATINGAKACGLQDVTGSLEIGKSADFISIDFDLIESQPIFNPAIALIYTTQSSHVENVWVAGKYVLKNRKLTTIDEADLRKRVHHWNSKIKKN